MSWAEEQDWFGLEDLVLQYQEEDDEYQQIQHLYWRTKDRRLIRYNNMTTQHIKNCINMINQGRLNRKWALPHLTEELNKRTKLDINNIND